MRIDSAQWLLVSAWATLLRFSMVASGFQNQPRKPWSQFEIHIPQTHRLQPLLPLNTISREKEYCRARIRLSASASAQDQDASTSDHVYGDVASPTSVENDTEEFHLSFNAMEETYREQNDEIPSEIVETSWSYWSTGSQLMQAGAVGATTGLLVAIFKLV
jgi:hypothetical protein